jgi:hypothetical protein
MKEGLWEEGRKTKRKREGGKERGREGGREGGSRFVDDMRHPLEAPSCPSIKTSEL